MKVEFSIQLSEDPENSVSLLLKIEIFTEAVFFSSVFFLVGGGFFLVFVLAVVSVCACHVYKSQSASHSPFFHLLATLLPSPEQARPIVWGREMPSIAFRPISLGWGLAH